MIHFLRKGYSLVELLVVISIIMVVFTIVNANYRAYTRKRALDGVAEGIKADIRLAQEYAISGKKPAGSCDALQGIYFRRMAGSYYRIEAYCKVGGVNRTCTTSPGYPDLCYKDAVYLPSGYTMGNIVPVTPLNNIIYFKLGGRGNYLDPASSPYSITITQPYTSATKAIYFTAGGEVY
ncbi:hypothetical protein A3A76_02580 [Candidatus Woesebacteria bacterium RIFCSPLOWO2_01_FULL_39_23]|nr:MAG: hypothetical protein A3A76_02580 [Candidatus Woesebacteria bacterium RIFCSPLOWO2_01_FULL_39_23]